MQASWSHQEAGTQERAGMNSCPRAVPQTQVALETKMGSPPTPRVFLSVQALPTHCWSKLVQVDVVGVTRYILARHVGIHQVFHPFLGGPKSYSS